MDVASSPSDVEVHSARSMIWDLITIGGGAAGFFGAITHAERGGGSTLILEKAAGVLGKVRISGGGRCNVTHQCFDPRAFSQHYPRGGKAMIGPLNRWSAEDTVDWFTSRDVRLKTEPDGRMFPTTDSSQTIVDCLMSAAEKAGVEVRTNCGIKRVIVNANSTQDHRFRVETETGDELAARSVLLATGGTRLTAGARLAEQLGHTLAPAVPSLFTFKIDDPRIAGLQGVSIPNVRAEVVGSKLTARGPLLITALGRQRSGNSAPFRMGRPRASGMPISIHTKNQLASGYRCRHSTSELARELGKTPIAHEMPVFDDSKTSLGPLAGSCRHRGRSQLVAAYQAPSKGTRSSADGRLVPSRWQEPEQRRICHLRWRSTKGHRPEDDGEQTLPGTLLCG